MTLGTRIENYAAALNDPAEAVPAAEIGSGAIASMKAIDRSDEC
jgi:hypothetical protein